MLVSYFKAGPQSFTIIINNTSVYLSDNIHQQQRYHTVGHYRRPEAWAAHHSLLHYGSHLARHFCNQYEKTILKTYLFYINRDTVYKLTLEDYFLGSLAVVVQSRWMEWKDRQRISPLKGLEHTSAALCPWTTNKNIKYIHHNDNNGLYVSCTRCHLYQCNYTFRLNNNW